MKLLKIWEYISNIGTHYESDYMEMQNVRLLNQFTFCAMLTFLGHSIYDFFIDGDIFTGYLTLVISLLLLSTMTVFIKPRRSKIIQCVMLIVLCCFVFVFESYYGIASGVYFYYFPLALILPFVFNYKTDAKYIFIVAIFIATAVMINIFTNYSLFINSKSFDPHYQRQIFEASSTNSVILVLFALIFLMKKNNHIQKLYDDTQAKEMILEEKEKQLELVQNVDSTKFQILTQLAIDNDPSFFTIFNELYPTFCQTLLKYAPDLSFSELEVCAYIKLNFSTKDMARYSAISLRAIEGRKYRIRKKLNFRSEKELITWMMNLKL